AWNGRGSTYGMLGQDDKALADFSQAIALDPNNAAAWGNRGYAHRALGRYDKACADYQKALVLAPAQAGPHNALAWLLATCPDAKLRDSNQAVTLARKAVQLVPRGGAFWVTLGVAHYRVGDWKAAVAALDKSRDLQKSGNACAWLFLAMAHRKLGNDAEARKAFNQA